MIRSVEVELGLEVLLSRAGDLSRWARVALSPLVALGYVILTALIVVNWARS